MANAIQHKENEQIMASSEERMKILKMVEEGKISVEDGAKLLAALGSNGNGAGAGASAAQAGFTHIKSPTGAKWFRIRVTDMATGKAKVNVNLPIGLVSVGVKIAGKFAPETDTLEVQQIIEAIRSGAQGKIIDVMDEDDGEHVEIYVE
jgi:hypothetical protein